MNVDPCPPSPAHLLAQRRGRGVAGALVGGVCSVGIEAEHPNLLVGIYDVVFPPRLCGGGEVPCREERVCEVGAGERANEGERAIFSAHNAQTGHLQLRM